MSADKWTECPRCYARTEGEYEALQKRVESEYGKLPKDEYFKLVKEAKEAPCGRTDKHLRVYYNISTDQYGNFSVVYSCRCRVCAFEHTFKHEEQLKI